MTPKQALARFRPKQGRSSSHQQRTTSMLHTHPIDGEPKVVVSIAVRGTPKPLLERAVNSILNQTYKNLLVVIASDGDKKPSWEGCSFVEDPRVVCWSISTRHGPYYAHELARKASEAPLFAVQDSDDWSDLRRIELLVRAVVKQDLDAAVPQNVLVDGTITKRPPPVRAPTEGIGYRTSHFWVVRSDAIEKLGSYYTGNGHICHSDTFLTNLVLDFGRVNVVPEALYYREKRQNSLETSTETGGGSPVRKKIDQELTRLYEVAHRRGLAALRHTLSKQTQTHEFRSHLNILRSKIPKIPHAEPVGTLETALAFFPFTDWSISRNCARALYKRCCEVKAKSIVDFGSGASTIALAYYARETGARVLSFEHDPKFFETTRETLRRAGLLQHVDLQIAPIKHREVQRISGRGYDFDLALVPELVDFVFIDGPPGSIGRRLTLPSIKPKLSSKWEAWLHDGCRPQEKADVEAWGRGRVLDFEAQLTTSADSRGVFVLRSQSQ